MTDATGDIEEQLPPYIIEGARSSRSKCKTCRKKIDQGALRIGILIEGPFGAGHLWHHLKCAARAQIERVEEAYELEAWKEAKEPPKDVPPIDELKKLASEAVEKKKNKKEVPYVERAPSGRARCKHCDEPIEKDALRVVLGRGVEFGRQMRVTPINVHPKCVAAELFSEDCITESEGFEDALRANSADVSAEELGQVMAAVGKLPG